MQIYTIALLGGIVLAGLLVIYPYLIYPFVLRLLPRKRIGESTQTEQAETSRRSAALLFCAYNEECSLPAKLDNIRAIRKLLPDLEILAYSDASSDKTEALLREASEFITVITGERRLGKIEGMRRLVASTEADILIFTDANVMLDPASIPRLLEYFDDPGIGAVSGTLLYSDEGTEHAVARVGTLYWRIEEHIKQLESATGSMMGADGSLFARRRQGYPDIPNHLADDLAVSMAVVFDGLRCVSAPDVFAFENAVTQSDEEFARKRRVACGSYATGMHFRNELRRMGRVNRFKWYSHRLMRWWGGALVCLSTTLYIAVFCSLGVGLEASGILLAAASGVVLAARLGLQSASALCEMLLGIFAAQIGVIEALIGRTYSTWKPATSR